MLNVGCSLLDVHSTPQIPKRCQPRSPPATAVQDAGASVSASQSPRTRPGHTFSKDWIAYKTGARSGNASVSLGAIPVPPTVPAPPAVVAADIFGRIAQFVARLKKHANYTEAIGEDLDIIDSNHVIDLNAMKPGLKLTLQAGHPNVGWKKKEMDGLEGHVDRGTGTFVLLAFDTEPDYLDTAALPAPGTSAVWRYKAIYRLHDQQVGQWSDLASISVMG